MRQYLKQGAVRRPLTNSFFVQARGYLTAETIAPERHRLPRIACAWS